MNYKVFAGMLLCSTGIGVFGNENRIQNEPMFLLEDYFNPVSSEASAYAYDLIETFIKSQGNFERIKSWVLLVGRDKGADAVFNLLQAIARLVDGGASYPDVQQEQLSQVFFINGEPKELATMIKEGQVIITRQQAKMLAEKLQANGVLQHACQMFYAFVQDFLNLKIQERNGSQINMVEHYGVDGPTHRGDVLLHDFLTYRDSEIARGVWDLVSLAIQTSADNNIIAKWLQVKAEKLGPEQTHRILEAAAHIDQEEDDGYFCDDDTPPEVEIKGGLSKSQADILQERFNSVDEVGRACNLFNQLLAFSEGVPQNETNQQNEENVGEIELENPSSDFDIDPESDEFWINNPFGIEDYF